MSLFAHSALAVHIYDQSRHILTSEWETETRSHRHLLDTHTHTCAFPLVKFAHPTAEPVCALSRAGRALSGRSRRDGVVFHRGEPFRICVIESEININAQRRMHFACIRIDAGLQAAARCVASCLSPFVLHSDSRHVCGRC